MTLRRGVELSIIVSCVVGLALAIATRSCGSPRLAMPVRGVDPATLHSNFADSRGWFRSHEALDILAPRGTPILAADDGVIHRLVRSSSGGITIYQLDRTGRWRYYYAHLQAYARGLAPGRVVRRGDVIGFVGTTGNARHGAPHLHFAVARLGGGTWGEGTPVDPLPLLPRSSAAKASRSVR